MRLKDKVAVITGAGSGMGLAIATLFVAEGAKVVAADWHEDALNAAVATIGGTITGIKTNVADQAQAEAMVDKAVSTFGRIDILVNNAGVAYRQRFVDTTAKDWHAQIDACLYGTIHCCHAAAPFIEKRQHGRIISLVGDSSRIGESGLSIVAAARGGTIALMKSLAREMGRSWTTCNTVSLGLVETQHSDKAWLDANREKLVRAYPIRRLGLPEDVAPTVVHLASPQAAWITGQVISVSGGYCMAG